MNAHPANPWQTMSYQDDLRAAFAKHLTDEYHRFGDIRPEDLVDVRVTWDNGDNYDPTYGDSPNSPPTFEVEVTYRNPVGDIERHTLDTAFTFTALLRMVLGVGDVSVANERVQS